MAYIAPNSPVADWRCVPQGHGYGNYFDPVTGTWATVTRTTPKTARVAADKLVDVPAGYLALEPWSIHKSGGVGLAAIIEEARTNACLDSYFANATIGTNWASDVTLSRDDSVTPPYDTHAALADYTGTAGDVDATKVLLSQMVVRVAGNAVTTSLWLRGAASGCQAQIYAEALDASDNVLGIVTANVTPSGTWTRTTVTYASMPTNTAKCRFGLRATGVDDGDTVTARVTAVQNELGAFATSYIPTTTAAATRNADVVTVPTTGWDAAVGTWIAVEGGQASPATSSLIFKWADADDSDIVYLTGIGGTYGNNLFNTKSTSYATGAVMGKSSTSHVSGGRLSAGQQWATSNGVVSAASDAAAATGMGATAFIGGWNGSILFRNGPIARFVVYASALTDEQLAAADMTTDLLAGLDTARITNEVTL